MLSGRRAQSTTCGGLTAGCADEHIPDGLPKALVFHKISAPPASAARGSAGICR